MSKSLDALGRQFARLEERSEEPRRPRARIGLLLAVCLLGGGGAAFAASSISDDPKEPAVVEICGDSRPSEENVADELDLAVDIEAVSNLARQIFADEFGGQYLYRDSCPSELRVLAVEPTAATQDRFERELGKLDGVDPSRVVVESATVSLRELEASKDAAAKVAADANLASFEIEPSVTRGLIVVSTPSELSRDLQSRIEQAASTAVDFEVSDGQGEFPIGP